METIKVTFRATGPWTAVGFGNDYQPEMPPFPAGGMVDGDLTRKLVLLTNDGKVYTLIHSPWGWPKEWSEQAHKREANPVRRQWLARHRFNRIAAQYRPA